MNTDAHFIIRDCEFIGKKYAAEYDPSVIVVEGILLQFENVRNGLVENCTFTALQSKRGNAYRSSRPKPRDG